MESSRRSKRARDVKAYGAVDAVDAVDVSVAGSREAGAAVLSSGGTEFLIMLVERLGRLEDAAIRAAEHMDAAKEERSRLAASYRDRLFDRYWLIPPSQWPFHVCYEPFRCYEPLPGAHACVIVQFRWFRSVCPEISRIVPGSQAHSIARGVVGEAAAAQMVHPGPPVRLENMSSVVEAVVRAEFKHTTVRLEQVTVVKNRCTTLMYAADWEELGPATYLELALRAMEGLGEQNFQRHCFISGMETVRLLPVPIEASETVAWFLRGKRPHDEPEEYDDDFSALGEEAVRKLL